jgi:hypothetical protein
VEACLAAQHGRLRPVSACCDEAGAARSSPRSPPQALDATKGMLYLHKRGIIHRDLKSPNLLVESTWKVKVRRDASGRPSRRTLPTASAPGLPCALSSPASGRRMIPELPHTAD